MEQHPSHPAGSIGPDDLMRYLDGEMTPEERAAVFIGLARTMESILTALPAAERQRRRDAARLIDPRPTPWWKNLRRSAWPPEE